VCVCVLYLGIWFEFNDWALTMWLLRFSFQSSCLWNFEQVNFGFLIASAILHPKKKSICDSLWFIMWLNTRIMHIVEKLVKLLMHVLCGCICEPDLSRHNTTNICLEL